MGKRNIARDGDRIPVQVGQIVDPDDADQDSDRKAPTGRTGRGGNVASGNAKVGQQVDGAVHGDITISFRR